MSILFSWKVMAMALGLPLLTMVLAPFLWSSYATPDELLKKMRGEAGLKKTWRDLKQKWNELKNM